jgi:hypothetical protein
MEPVSPILVDPNQFYINLILNLSNLNLGADQNTLALITITSLDTLVQSACSEEDKPKNFKRFVEHLDDYVDSILGNLEDGTE